VEVYTSNLRRFEKVAPLDLEACSYAVVTEYLARLQQIMKPVSVHQHYRSLRTFFRWCVNVEYLQRDPIAGLRMKIPKALPKVPEAEDVKRLLNACVTRRDKALVALLIDSGLRISEAIALRVGDLNLADGTINIRNGKGGKDGIGLFGADSSRHVRAWLNSRTNAHVDDLLFVTNHGDQLTRHAAARILYRISKRAGLEKKIGPHALRHFAATALLRQTGDLELVRRVLRHESLTMTLRYAALTGIDVSTKFRRASPLSSLL
jgi:integrase/recombinase XerD